jgi:hypothetical protein
MYQVEVDMVLNGPQRNKMGKMCLQEPELRADLSNRKLRGTILTLNGPAGVPLVRIYGSYANLEKFLLDYEYDCVRIEKCYETPQYLSKEYLEDVVEIMRPIWMQEVERTGISPSDEVKRATLQLAKVRGQDVPYPVSSPVLQQMEDLFMGE